MTLRTARPASVGAGRAAVRRWSAPAVQGLALAAVLVVAQGQVAGARADAAADRGRGPQVAVAQAVRAVAPPVVLGIPELGITTRLSGLRRDLSGALQVPEDPSRAGWYSQGPAPGDLGPAVVVGHVDSFEGPGVFAKVGQLTAGSQIRVRRADGSLVTFAVTQVQRYAKRDFPTDVVYGAAGASTLRLITCGGDFDRASGSYRDNVVVFAELVA